MYVCVIYVLYMCNICLCYICLSYDAHAPWCIAANPVI